MREPAERATAGSSAHPRATGRYAGSKSFGMAYPGFAALTPGFMPSSAPRTGRASFRGS